MDPLKIKGRGRLRVQMRPDAGGVTFWIDSEDSPEFWCELRLDSADLFELMALVGDHQGADFLDFPVPDVPELLPLALPDVPELPDPFALPDVPEPPSWWHRDEKKP